jgi:hypothetical protein
MPINMPKKQESILSKLAVPAATVGGALVGSAIPGAGTAAGAALGASLGGAAGGLVKGIANRDVGQAAEGVASGARAMGGVDALERRLAKQQQPANPEPAPAPQALPPQAKAVQDGMAALQELPPDAQDQYGPQLSHGLKQMMRSQFLRSAGHGY